MIQGTSSDAGKSLIVAGLCRLFARRGLTVRPFKPQNMSNNAGVTVDGGEIGRAQLLQARAAFAEPSVHMNPVLLKPQSETGSQVVVHGRVLTVAAARDYTRLKSSLMQPVLQSFDRLCHEADLVIVEGAGSPAEINLRAGDIANMGFACAADVPVALVADIERGGVIANLAGTHLVLTPEDRAMVAGTIVNKFRGDPRLFDDGLQMIKTHTGWRSFGVVPWFEGASRLPAEDTLGLAGGFGDGPVRIVMPRLPHIANFDDADPLRLERCVSFKVVSLSDPLPTDTDVVLLPGSKSTVADARALHEAGWHIDLQAHVRRGGSVVGLCGGYQLLGTRIADPDGVEGPPGEVAGLGLLEVTTLLRAPKRTELAAGTGRHVGPGTPVSGYRIHMGLTDGPDRSRPVVMLADGPDGAVSRDGRVWGTYLHGLFAADAFRDAFLRGLGAQASDNYEGAIDGTLDALAAHLSGALDIDAILAAAYQKARARPQ